MSRNSPLTNRPRLRVGRWAGGILALLSLCGISLLRAQSPNLPSGAEQEKVTNACTECHDASIIMQQRLTKAAWAKEVDKMSKWGALVGAPERDAFIDYLSTNFPADKDGQPEQRIAPQRKH
jgi:hypothetical protein